jgi:hypothetical protein
VDSLGNPLADGFAVIYEGVQFLPGDYLCSYTGVPCTFSIDGCTISNIVTTGSGSSAVTTFTTTFPVSKYQGALLAVRISGTTGGIKNLKVLLPGHALTDQINKSLIQMILPGMVMRYMDYLLTVINPDTEWSSRCPPAATNLSYFNSQPLEQIILIANATQSHVWINIPRNANTDYITKMAQLFLYGSDGTNPYTTVQASPTWPPIWSGANIYIEYGNEVWNSGQNSYFAFLSVLDNRQYNLASGGTGAYKPGNYGEVVYQGTSLGTATWTGTLTAFDATNRTAKFSALDAQAQYSQYLSTSATGNGTSINLPVTTVAVGVAVGMAVLVNGTLLGNVASFTGTNIVVTTTNTTTWASNAFVQVQKQPAYGTPIVGSVSGASWTPTSQIIDPLSTAVLQAFPGNADGFPNHNRLYALKVCVASELWRAVWGDTYMPGGNNPRIRPVVTAQAGYPYVGAVIFDVLFGLLAGNYSLGVTVPGITSRRICDYLWGLGGAPYAGFQYNLGFAPSTVDDVFGPNQVAMQEVYGGYNIWNRTMKAYAAFAAGMNLKTVGYEANYALTEVTEAISFSTAVTGTFVADEAAYQGTACVFLGSITGNVLTVSSVVSGTITAGYALCATRCFTWFGAQTKPGGIYFGVISAFGTSGTTGTGGIGTYALSGNYTIATGTRFVAVAATGYVAGVYQHNVANNVMTVATIYGNFAAGVLTGATSGATGTTSSKGHAPDNLGYMAEFGAKYDDRLVPYYIMLRDAWDKLGGDAMCDEALAGALDDYVNWGDIDDLVLWPTLPRYKGLVAAYYDTTKPVSAYPKLGEVVQGANWQYPYLNIGLPPQQEILGSAIPTGSQVLGAGVMVSYTLGLPITKTPRVTANITGSGTFIAYINGFPAMVDSYSYTAVTVPHSSGNPVIFNINSDDQNTLRTVPGFVVVSIKCVTGSITINSLMLY